MLHLNSMGVRAEHGGLCSAAEQHKEACKPVRSGDRFREMLPASHGRGHLTRATTGNSSSKPQQQGGGHRSMSGLGRRTTGP